MAKEVNVSDISEFDESQIVRCDVLIIGGGPAGLTVARGLAGSKRDVLILESGGFVQSPDVEDLNEVIVAPDNWTEKQARRRVMLHGPQSEHWRHDIQGYGVRCRMVGGSTAAWAGKSAAFDAIDFEARSWVRNSGWPVQLDELTEHLDNAASTLGLGVNCYDDQLWERMGRSAPEPSPDPSVLRSFFWQFARSSINPMDVMRVGEEFMKDAPEGCRLLTGATVVEILTGASGKGVTGVVVVDAAGTKRNVEANTIVLAASAIENARLLLNSTQNHPSGLGNQNDTVGRYLMDHPDVDVAHFDKTAIKQMSQHFGFFGLSSPSGVNMYARGLAPTAEVQTSEEMLNCSIYMVGERAPDDPWSAGKRIAKRQSKNYFSDALAILKSPIIVAKGIGRLAFQSDKFPKSISHAIVNQIVRFMPNFAVKEYLTKGVPLKLVGLSVRVICEQVPDPENRIYLSDRTDQFGMRLAAARWKVGDQETQNFVRVANVLQREFESAGLPMPVLDDWIRHENPQDAAITDMAHSAGTTRMSVDPKCGVVDANCKVHGVEGLYVAGASVFPTSGHANPTLMIMTFAYRLAAHLKLQPTGPEQFFNEAPAAADL